jgi:hypothetical protein
MLLGIGRSHLRITRPGDKLLALGKKTNQARALAPMMSTLHRVTRLSLKVVRGSRSLPVTPRRKRSQNKILRKIIGPFRV